MVLRYRASSVRAAVALTAVAAFTAFGSPLHDISGDAAARSARPVVHDPFGTGKWGNDTTHQTQQATVNGSWHAEKDHGSMNYTEQRYGAVDTWGKDDAVHRKLTGDGVTVAVIDTGVSPVDGLNTPGKVINGPDLSFESQSPDLRYLDGYGHGTHIAGIIAGHDPTTPDHYKDPKNFEGIAPDANILNMKVGTSDGAVDVTQVIAALNWVVQHRTDNGMNVRVINLSYGTHATQPYTVDPLAKAVEDAWRAGIVVVAAAGNDGAGAPLTMPAADPYVIAVGAMDNHGTDDVKDDTVAAFSSTGTSSRRPDILAPGKSIVSLRDPGSEADVQHPEGDVSGDASTRFFRGSGTSQGAAIVSGAAALIAQARPGLTPDQIKADLMASEDQLGSTTPVQPTSVQQGSWSPGVLDLKQATALALSTKSPSVTQAFPTSSGLGSLDASRGDSIVTDPANGKQLVGEVDALGGPWDAATWAAASSTNTAWNAGTWNGETWTGDGWDARSWSGAAWSNALWSGDSWSGRSWSGRSWSGDDWSGRSWSGNGWVSRSWSDAAWGDDGAW